MGLLSSGLRSLLQRGGGPYVRGTVITLPSTTWRFAETGFATVGGGYQFDGRIQQFGDVVYGPSDRGGSMNAVELVLEVADTDRMIAQYKEGAYGDLIARSPAVSYVMHPGLAAGNWLTLHTGVVSRIDFPRPMVAQITIRVDDLALEHEVPKGTWRLTSDDWPNADPSVWGQFAPFAYGTNDSSGWTNRGFIPCLYVDKTGFRYLVSAGRAMSVPAVYADNVKAATSTYAITYPVVRGKQYTLIDFTADQGTKAITADVQGYESVGDGTGTFLALPTDQIAHYLTNFVFGDYRKGPWAATSARIDTGTLAAMGSFLSDRGYPGGRYISSPGRAANELSSWLTSLELVAYWTNLGTMAFGVDDPTELNIYPSSPLAIQPGGWSTQDDNDRQVVGAAVVSYINDSVAGQPVQTLQVQEPKSTAEGVAAIAMAWGGNS